MCSSKLCIVNQHADFSKGVCFDLSNRRYYSFHLCFCSAFILPDAGLTHTGRARRSQNNAPGEPAPLPQPPSIAVPPNQPQTLPSAPQPQKASIIGTVTDVKGSIVPSATVVLQGSVLSAPLTITANDKGFFEFTGLEPGTYHVTASAKGFANWTSPAIMLKPGQSVILTGCRLKVAEARTTVYVGIPPSRLPPSRSRSRSSSAFSASSPISTSSMTPTPSRSRRS